MMAHVRSFYWHYLATITYNPINSSFLRTENVFNSQVSLMTDRAVRFYPKGRYYSIDSSKASLSIYMADCVTNGNSTRLLAMVCIVICLAYR